MAAATVASVPGSGSAVAQEAGSTTLVRADSEAAVDLSVAWSRLIERSVPPDDCPFLARDDHFADALAAGAGIGTRSGPLLLTARDALSPGVDMELDRLEVERVFLLGGPDAVSVDVEQELRDDGVEVERIGGASRIDTAVAIARRFYPENSGSDAGAGTAVVVRAYGAPEDSTMGFADSIAAGRYAAGVTVPLLLTESAELSPQVRDYLVERADESSGSALRHIDVVGGHEAVDDRVVEQIRELGLEVRRVGGADRAEPAVQVAVQLYELPSAAEAYAVTVEDAYQPTSWASGFASIGVGPLLVSAGDGLPSSTAAWLEAADGDARLTCGPLTTIAACEDAAALMGNRPPPSGGTS